MCFKYLIPSITRLIAYYDSTKINEKFMFCELLVNIIFSNIEKDI